MLSDITLGSFFPGTSFIHKRDPRVKFIAVFLTVIMQFSAKTYVGFGVCALFSILLVALSGIPVSTISKSLKPILFILLFTVVANIFWTKGDTLLLSYGVITIYKEGLIFAGLMALRIICLIISTFVLLTYTTSPVSLTDALEKLLSPLAKTKLPVHEFAMMMSIALRFIPTLLEETDKIISAQKARGADFESGNILKRVKSLIPILIPLFVSAFRRADELANAMECRLYTGGHNRTRMKVLRMNTLDVVFLLANILLVAVIYITNGMLTNIL